MYLEHTSFPLANPNIGNKNTGNKAVTDIGIASDSHITPITIIAYKHFASWKKPHTTYLDQK